MRRWLVPLLVVVLATACIQWDPVLNVQDMIAATHPEQIRVTLTNGDQVVVYDPSFADSSIAGTASGASSLTHVQYPMSEVKRVEVPTTRPPSNGELLWVVAGVAVVFAAIKVL